MAFSGGIFMDFWSYWTVICELFMEVDVELKK